MAGLSTCVRPGAGGPSAGAYAGGLVAGLDTVLGRHFNHAGGLPGYGSHMLLVPDRGFAVFGFANRTYAPVLDATFQAARLIAEHFAPYQPAPSSELRFIAEEVLKAVCEQSLTALEAIAADNLFRDTPPDEFLAGLITAAARTGVLRGHELVAEQRHAGVLTVTGELGSARARLMLAPLAKPRLQRLTWLDDDG